MIEIEAVSGKRLDQCVAEAMPQLSRAYVQKLCEQGKISVNGEPSKVGYKLRERDSITVDYDPANYQIPEIDLPIIYEDKDCVVMNKPAGLLTHAQGALSPEATVATFLRSRANQPEVGPLEELSEANYRTGVVHRLDRATSGVIIGAKNQEALSWLQKQFSQRKVKKTYIAIVEGTPKQEEAVIDMPIERNPKAPATFRVGTNGKHANTHYKVLQQNDKYSLLELKPETGRTHQLRVHLQKIGHPIIGDPLYGNGKFGDRLYLHALELEITIPNRSRKTFNAPLPPEFNELLK
jgi:23S rRNA pseudouridine1911/1915/1917 synthase